MKEEDILLCLHCHTQIFGILFEQTCKLSQENRVCIRKLDWKRNAFLLVLRMETNLCFTTARPTCFTMSIHVTERLNDASGYAYQSISDCYRTCSNSRTYEVSAPCGQHWHAGLTQSLVWMTPGSWPTCKRSSNCHPHCVLSYSARGESLWSKKIYRNLHSTVCCR